MKKLFTILFAFLAFATTQKVFAQCTPDLSWNTSGIRPDSATNLPDGCENVPYSTQMDIYVPDSVHQMQAGQSVAIYIDSVRLLSVTGLPPGMTYVTNPTDGKFAKYAHGCALISGTCATPGNYPLTVITKASVRLLLPFIPATVRYDTVRYYRININAAGGANCNVGIESHLDPTEMGIHSVVANAYDNYLQVTCNAPLAMPTGFRVINSIGQTIYAKQVNTQQGYQIIRLNDFYAENGIYILQMQQGNQFKTYKLQVTK
jgi:hypothetical protein